MIGLCDLPGYPRLVGGGPAPHRSATSGEAYRPMTGLPATGRWTGHPNLVGRSKIQSAVEMTAVWRHPLWTAAHVGASVCAATLTEGWKRVIHTFSQQPVRVFICSALPSTLQRNVEPSQHQSAQSDRPCNLLSLRQELTAKMIDDDECVKLNVKWGGDLCTIRLHIYIAYKSLSQWFP